MGTRLGRLANIVCWGTAVALAAAPLPRSHLAAEEKAPAELSLALDDGVKLDLVLIPAGSFRMGDDDDRDAQPARAIDIAQPFYLGKFEVTQEQWTAVVRTPHAATTTRGAKLPVDTVEWWECQTFCQRLAARFPGKAFRLPTEAEWEYAARAGSKTKYGFGDDAAELEHYAWYRRPDDMTPNPRVTGVADTHPVGLKRPNAWGLYDMHGNVREWCQSRWAAYPYDADDGRETPPIRPARVEKDPRVLKDAHVVRGGSWHHGAKAATSFHRAAARPADHRYYYGFRVALPVAP